MTFVETESELATDTVDCRNPEHEPVDTESPDGTRSQFARWGLTSLDVLVLMAGAVFCAGNGPFEFTSWTPRMAALLAGLPLGLLVLVRLARHRDKAAIVALVFLAWGVVGAATSDAPLRSLIGQVNGNTQSVMMFAGVFGFWALARTMSERGRALVGPVLVSALGVTAFVGIVQIAFDIRSGMLGAIGGRAGGLEGNAVYFATSLCGALAWCASTSLTAVEQQHQTTQPCRRRVLRPSNRPVGIASGDDLHRGGVCCGVRATRGHGIRWSSQVSPPWGCSCRC